MRSRPKLTAAATIASCLALLVIQLGLVRPALTVHDGAFDPVFLAMRVFFLAGAGGLSATLAGLFRSRAESAVRAVRERDLMGKYLLHERLGAGGMAEVFRATYTPEGGFARTVAVKRVLPGHSDDPEFSGMFRQEAHLGSLLTHPNVVQVLDVGTFQGTYFIAMEHIDGLPLGKLLRARGGLPPAAVAYLAAELGAALEYIHARTDHEGRPLALVHRDLNPPNILVSRIGEVKLADFGIARATNVSVQTQAGVIKGKLNYMAPEQLLGTGLDGRADSSRWG